MKPIRSGKRNSTSGNRESCQSKDQEIDQKCKVHSSEVLREKVQTKYVVQYKELSTEHTQSVTGRSRKERTSYLIQKRLGVSS